MRLADSEWFLLTVEIERGGGVSLGCPRRVFSASAPWLSNRLIHTHTHYCWGAQLRWGAHKLLSLADAKIPSLWTLIQCAVYLNYAKILLHSHYFGSNYHVLLSNSLDLTFLWTSWTPWFLHSFWPLWQQMDCAGQQKEASLLNEAQKWAGLRMECVFHS